MEGVRNVLKVSELNNSVKERAYKRACVKNMKCGECGGVGKKFRYIVMECTNDVCDMRRVSGQRRKGSEWWNEELGRVNVVGNWRMPVLGDLNERAISLVKVREAVNEI